jgi:integrase
VEKTISTDSIEEFRTFLSDRGWSPNTIRAYATDVRLCFSDRTTDNLFPLTMVELEMMRWLNSHRRTWGPRTFSRKVTSLRSYLKWLGFTNPLTGIKLPTAATPEPHPLPGGLSDLERLIAAAVDPDDVILVALCGLVGLRIGEALAVRSEDFDIASRTVLIKGKGEKFRRLPLSVRAFKLLIDRIAERFLDGGGTLLTCSDRSARKAITALGRQANIARPISSHDLRATFATMAYERTKDLLMVSRLLGHANTQTTQMYVGTDREKLRDAASFAEEDDE